MIRADRRRPLRLAGITASIATLALAVPTSTATAAGPPVTDPNGIINLPAGMSYTVLATGGQTPVTSTESGATFVMPEDFDANIVVPARGKRGGTWLVTAHELTKPVTGDFQGDVGKAAVEEQAATDDGDSDGWGSVTRLRLGKDGKTVQKAQVITTGLHNLCAGARTPWKTFLVNEEFPFRSDPDKRSGWVWEVNPYTGKATKLTGMGRFSHEQQVRVGKTWYLTDDTGNYKFLFKFVPDKAKDLRTGKLYGLKYDRATATGVWVGPLDPMDPYGANGMGGIDAVRYGFDKAEGMTVKNGRIVFTESGSRASDPANVDSPGRVWSMKDSTTGMHGRVLVEGDFAKLSHPDNIRFTPAGDLLILEDNGSALTRAASTGKAANGGMNEIYVLPKGMTGAENLKLLATVPDGAEPTGPAFSRNGKLLYLSIQGDPSRSIVISGHKWTNRYTG